MDTETTIWEVATVEVTIETGPNCELECNAGIVNVEVEVSQITSEVEGNDVGAEETGTL